jgi:L-2-hydroxyglutarate oxidase LhgO
MSSIDTLIVGGGLVGLAAAGELAAAGLTVAVAERHPRAGLETSTHNSGVLHAGIYYPKGTLKAELCVEGVERLYDFCTREGVPHERCGKLIVAESQDEMGALEALASRGTANGVRGLEIVDREFVRAREPHVAACAALWSPNTGRVEAEALVGALLRRAHSRDAIMLRSARVMGAEAGPSGFTVRLERETIAARTIVAAAGLYADDVSRSFGGESFTIYPCRGEFAEVRRSRCDWVNGLVYPLPLESGHGLGVHLTKTVGGAVLLGPTAKYQSEKDNYERDRLPLEDFVEPARRLLPGLTLDDITYGGSGIRPTLHPPEQSFADFMIRADRHQPALIHASGIDSPGLTACLAIAVRVAGLVKECLA